MSPASGPLRGTAGQEHFLVTKSPHREPHFGAAEYIVSGGMGVSTPINMYEPNDFQGKFLRGIEKSLLGLAHFVVLPPVARASPYGDTLLRVDKNFWGESGGHTPVSRKGLASKGKTMISPEPFF